MASPARLAEARRHARKGDDQRFRFDFLEQQLDAAIFDFQQILEQEHLVDHLGSHIQ